MKKKKKWAPHKEKYVWAGEGVYTMENSTNTDYHRFIRVGEQKWETVEITNGIIFFYLRFAFTIFYTGSFQVPPEKNHPHQKC